jgi:hypothetical protein
MLGLGSANGNYWINNDRSSSAIIFIRIFDESDHLRECIGKKDHLWKLLPKRTSAEWRQAWAGGTWHLPPGAEPAGGCRHP